MTFLRTCVDKDGHFIVGVHKPEFRVKNLRKNDFIDTLGIDDQNIPVNNQANFPHHDLHEPNADTVYEIANPFPFRGTTYINSAWADSKAINPGTIKIAEPDPCSFLKNYAAENRKDSISHEEKIKAIDMLPHPLIIALAQASTDPEELVILAEKSCLLHFDSDRNPVGMGYKKKQAGKTIPDILDHELFEVLVNNPYLPDSYKNTMVLKPGVQGNNEITGEYISEDKDTHVFEYLRRNSYIPWGHFASNMANDAIRYSTKQLSLQDMTGIRHLYYQRAYARLAADLDVPLPDKQESFTQDELEALRQQLLKILKNTPDKNIDFSATLWGWNFGFGYAQSGHRLHASHQMIHQQNAMIPGQVATAAGNHIPSFACGDMIAEFIELFRKNTGKQFFKAYLKAIQNNTRTDLNPDGPSSLIVAEDDYTILFAPKAQISEWELQLMPKTDCGNILEADTLVRKSLDKGILLAVKTLEHLGAKMVTSIEFSKRFNACSNDQRLLYSFIPRLPYAPGTFSEAQLRWISGLYPEDFALACRKAADRFQERSQS